MSRIHQPIKRDSGHESEDRHAGQHDRRDAEDRHPAGCARRCSAGHGCFALPTLTAGDPAQCWSALTSPNTAEPGATSASAADTRAGQQRRAGTDGGAGADLDLADVHDVAVDPVPGQVDLGFDRAAVAEFEHARDRRQRVQVDAVADLGAEGAGEVEHPRCAGQVGGTAGLGQAQRDPQPQVFTAAARIGARVQAAQQQCAPRRRRWPSGRAG